jgi:hypothetical protein
MKNLVTKLLTISAAFIVCSSVCLSQQTTSNVPAGWKKINAKDDSLTFYMPKSGWDIGWSGLDEYYREYRIGKLRLMFVYEPTMRLAYDRREKEFGKGFREGVVEIAGRKAYLFTYEYKIRGRTRYSTDLYVGDFPKGEVKLWMQADSWRPKDLEVAKKIFGTVEFLK